MCGHNACSPRNTKPYVFVDFSTVIIVGNGTCFWDPSPGKVSILMPLILISGSYLKAISQCLVTTFMFLWDQTRQAGLWSQHAPVHQLSFLGSLLIGTHHCILETLYKACCFGDALMPTIWSLIL